MTTKIPGNMLQNGFTASAPQYLTASGTYAPSANCRAVLIEAIGGGGSSGSTAATGASTCAGSSGGGGGGYTAKFIVGPAASYPYTIGAGGTPAASGTNNGGDGGNTTIAGMTAGGGKGGTSIAPRGTFAAILPVAGGTATGGDINVQGAPATVGVIDAVNGNTFGSGGGGSPLGAGGMGSTNAVGAVATGYGAGAHGLAKGFSAAAAAGVAGTAGVIRVTEFF